jgi:translation initiation factor RLI1
MDVAYYLSELLGQLGEVNVPGLGYFVQIRIEGYYNADDSTFYPQKNKVQFDPQIIDDDDDTLAQYIADKKNISLASSRYFTSKYISNLKQEAILKDVPLADLGFLYIEGPNVTFKVTLLFS